jgi:hypothetical protein
MDTMTSSDYDIMELITGIQTISFSFSFPKLSVPPPYTETPPIWTPPPPY